MNPKEFFDEMYGKVEDQHERLDEIAQNLKHFNPVRAKAGIAAVINCQHAIKDTVIKNIEEIGFSGLFEHISRVYSSGALYKTYADPSSPVIPPVDFAKAFVEEARGMLYVVTAKLTSSVMPSLQGEDRNHYLKSAIDKAILRLEEAVNLSSETTLARSLVNGAKKYQNIWQSK